MNQKEFYNAFAQEYDVYAETKRLYLESVDAVIFSLAKPAGFFVDIGCGTGKRTRKLGEKIHASRIIGVDNSPRMLKEAQINNAITVQQIDLANEPLIFDEKAQMVSCLWNVLGHVGQEDVCIAVLKKIRELLDHDGVAVIDVNNRYNASQYTFQSVARNLMKDIVSPSFSNGNFSAKLPSDESIVTTVHIFSPQEMRRMLLASGFEIIQELYVDYNTGKHKKCWFSGQLVYVVKSKNIL